MNIPNETEEIRIESKIQLLVEGNDERNFFEAFIKYHSEKLSLRKIQIQNFKGGTQFNAFLRSFVNMSGFYDEVWSIGIVRDAEMQDAEKSAENAAENAFKSVQGALKNAELPVPDCPEKRKVDGKLAVEVLILPGRDHKKGMLETLLCQTFAGTKIDDCISEFFQCVEPLLREPIKEHQKDKAKAFAYLATRSDSHHSVGVAAKQGCWDLDHKVFDGIREFLKRIVASSKID